ncbi:MAG TPA: hypothetical protein VE779_12195 [Candidatus Angelobacter sp.]|jgi:hypothetical protein|nr:hypothetical protein [Candidatus Angelobacter sp.]
MSVLIKILYVLFVLGTAALIGVGIGVLLRVRRHLNQAHTTTPPADTVEATQPPGDDQAT